VEEIELLAPEVKKEPVAALAAGKDGLDIVRRILDQAPSFLEPHGWIMMEVDPRQVDELLRYAATAHFSADGEAICDLSGRKRIVVWQVA
jgi:methylase of polypeptide subunit release factors